MFIVLFQYKGDVWEINLCLLCAVSIQCVRDQSMFTVCCFNTMVMCERSIRVYCVPFQYNCDV